MRTLFLLLFSAASLAAQSLEQLIEVRQGTLPVVLTVPHGGGMRPESMLARRYGITGSDSNTIPLALLISEELTLRYGAKPHLIISHLHRSRLDPNREIKEAAQGDATAEAAWHRFHDSAQAASDTVAKKHGLGLLLDIHGHRHVDQRVELGYLVRADQLRASDPELEADLSLIANSSIRDLDRRSPATFAALLRGSHSLGSLLEARGFRSVPSPDKPHPGIMAGYFSGAYTVAAHGSRDGGSVSAIQIECPWNGLRDKPENQRRFARALAEALGVYFEVHLAHPLK